MYTREEVHKLMCKAFIEGWKKADVVEAGLEGLATDVECAWILTRYDSAPENKKGKTYTEEDLRKAYYYGKSMMTPQNFEKFIKSLQPKTEWDVEFVNGKLKLK